MDAITIVMYAGFILAAYSVIGNDVIQTLGTFLSSNEKRPWWVLWLFAGSILSAVLIYGWTQYGGDVSYNRLQVLNSDGTMRYKNPVDIQGFGWIFLLPPIVLLILTRTGIPVSTSFLILTFFSPKGLYDMVVKSMSGYLVAFVAAVAIYLFVTKSLERRFVNNPIKQKEKTYWTIAQWASTGFLWSQWLIQDFANIYVYLPRSIDLTTLIWTLAVLLALLAYIFYARGGAIQKIVKSKTNTTDIRAATFIDLIYGIVLYFFKELNDIPMSTTWVFIGLLAGRELAIRYLLDGKISNETLGALGRDLGKVFLGLIISIILVVIIYTATGQPIGWR